MQVRYMLCTLMALASLIASVNGAAQVTGTSSPTSDGFTVALQMDDPASSKVLDFCFTDSCASVEKTVSGANPAASPITGLQSGSYYIRVTDALDGAQSTHGPYSTLCTAGAIVKLETNASDVSTVPTLTLKFRENHQFSSIEYAFINQTTGSDAGALCKSVAGTHGTWSPDAGNTATCDSPTMTYTVDFNTALEHCSFTRDETDPALTVFQATIQISTKEPGSVIRGVQYEKTTVTTVVIQIAFKTTVSASSGVIDVFGERITQATVVDQTFDSTTATATVTLLSSVQWPYQLNSPNMTAVSGWNVQIVPENVDSTTTASNAAECRDADMSNGYTEDQPCAQRWLIIISRTDSCGPSNPELDITYSGWAAGYGVSCHSTFTGSCDTPNPGSDSVTFDTASDNYCPRLIDTEEATADLKVYEYANYTKEQNEFVFGTISYFEAICTSSIDIQNLHAEKISITQGGASGTSSMYTNPFTNAASYFNNNPAGTSQVAGDGSYGAGANSQSFDNSAGMAVFDDVPSSDKVRKNRFYWRWNDQTSAASGDFAEETVVKIDMRIRYADQGSSGAGKVSRIRMMYAPAQKKPKALAAPKAGHMKHTLGARNKVLAAEPGTSGALSAERKFGVTGGSDAVDNGLPPQGNDQSTGGSFPVGIVAGCALAAVSVFAIFAIVRRRRKKQEEEALAQTSSQVQLPSSVKNVPSLDNAVGYVAEPAPVGRKKSSYGSIPLDIVEDRV